MSDNIKKGVGSEHFTYVRKGILQGSSGPTLLTSPRLIGMLEATPPSPPDHPDFYYPELEELLPVNLTVKLESQPAIEISIASANVTDIMQTLGDALEDFTISFSQRKITVAGPGTLKYFAFLESDSPDFARILKFPFQNAYAATSINHVDQGALAKNRETFIQKYENNLSDAVNRALSSLASNLEAHHVYLSDPFAVPKFVNTIENASILEPITRDGSVVGLILRDRAYLGTEHNLSPQELERLFTLTDAYGYESLNLIDLGVIDGQPIRISEVTTGDGGTPRKYEADFQDWGNANAVADTRGDGKSVLPCSVYTLDNDTIPILEVLDGCMVRLDYPDPLTEDLVPINSVLVIKGSSHNNGTYLVESVCDSNTLQIRPYEKGRDVLLSSGALGEATLRMGSFPDFSPDQELYLWFDTPVLETNILHGIGLFYAQHCTLKDLLQDTLTSSTIPGLATDDILVRSLRSIRGPNSRDYRSLLIGELESDVGDSVSLESLSGRRLLGRDRFDLSGADESKSVDSILQYKTTDGSNAIASANTPLTLYRDLSSSSQALVADKPFEAIPTSNSVDFDKYTHRYGNTAGPFDAILVDGYSLVSDIELFYPTDVGLTVLVHNKNYLPDEDPAYHQFMKVWFIERWISPNKVILNSPDTPNMYIGNNHQSIEVLVTFGKRTTRNLSGGASLRLDSATVDGDGLLSHCQLNALILTGSHGLTGVTTAKRVHTGGLDFYNKNEYLYYTNNKIRVLGANILDNPGILDFLHSYAGFESSRVNRAIDGTVWQFTPIVDKFQLQIPTRKHTALTLVELVSTRGDLDGLFLLNSTACNLAGDLLISLQTLDGTEVDEETLLAISGVGANGFGGRVRFYNMTICQNLKYGEPGIFGGGDQHSYRSAIDFSSLGITENNETPNTSTARFTGFGKLACILDVSVTDPKQEIYPAVYEGQLINSAKEVKFNKPYYGISVTTAAPVEAGIHVSTSSWNSTDGLKHEDQANGGAGIKVASFTSSRAMLKKMADLENIPTADEGLVDDSLVYPRTAGLIVQQVNYQGSEDNSYVEDPIYRDPAAIFAGTVTQETNIAEKLTGGIDSNSVVISYLHSDVYQASEQQTRWGITLQNPGNQQQSLKIFRKDKGDVGTKIRLVFGDVGDISFNGTILTVTYTHVWPTVVQLRTYIQNNFSDHLECSEISGNGNWLIGARSVAAATVQDAASGILFTPDGINQLNSNAAVESINGDIVITDGMLKIQSKNDRLVGVGSDLIPVNHAEGYGWVHQVIHPNLPAAGFDLGEPKVYVEEEEGTIEGYVLTLEKTKFVASDVGRKLIIVATVGESETTYYRHIGAVTDGNIVLNEYIYPVVAWDSLKVTVYGRRWSSIHVRNTLTDTITADSIYGESISTPWLTVTDTATVTHLDANTAEITVLTVTDLVIKEPRINLFIPGTSFMSRGTFRRIYDNFTAVRSLAGLDNQSVVAVDPPVGINLSDLLITPGDILRIHKAGDENINNMFERPTLTEYYITEVDSPEENQLTLDTALPRSVLAEQFSIVRPIEVAENIYPIRWNTSVSGFDPDSPGILREAPPYVDFIKAHRILVFCLYPDEIFSKVGTKDVKITKLSFIFSSHAGEEEKKVTIFLHKMSINTDGVSAPIEHPIFLQSSLEQEVVATNSAIVSLEPRITNLGVSDVWTFSSAGDTLSYMQMEVQIPHNTEFVGVRVFYEQI